MIDEITAWANACAWLLLRTHQSAIGLELLIVTALLVYATVMLMLSRFQ